jgi:uncharacterized protein YcaQ
VFKLHGEPFFSNTILTIQRFKGIIQLNARLVNPATSAQISFTVAEFTATLAAIEQLSYVQIDTISVIQRAHHHTLWNRNPRYSPLHIDQLLAEKQIFEYWSHAAAYLPMSNYRYSLKTPDQ